MLRTECVKSLGAVLFQTEHSVVNAGCLSSATSLNLSCSKTVLAIFQVKLSRCRRDCHQSGSPLPFWVGQVPHSTAVSALDPVPLSTRTPGQRLCSFSFELQTLPFWLCCWAAGCQHHRAGAECGGSLGAFGTHSPGLAPHENP